jgi:hypothetical protein
MIVRIFRVRVLPGKTHEWQDRVEVISIPWLRKQDGLIAFYPGKPIEPEGREFSMISIWSDVDSIRRAVGKEWQRAALLENEAALVETVVMHHFETFGMRMIEVEGSPRDPVVCSPVPAPCRVVLDSAH